MQFTIAAAALAFAATISAQNTTISNVTSITEVFTAYTTYCPVATELTFNGHTYTAHNATTLVITNCPCTVVAPVTTASSVICSTCAAPTSPSYVNSSAVATGGSVGTVSIATPAATTAATSPTSPPISSPPPITASSGNQIAALSAASLAGLLGLAAFFL